MKGEPILIDCEGSNARPCAVTLDGFGLCAMCGRSVSLVADVVLAHQRDDILARLARGDFDQ